MKTAVIYARYSSDRQTEQSIEGQLRVCQDYASRNEILIVDTYIDRAMTGTNDNRASFQKMLKDSAKREWDYVLVYKIDRFSRNKYETAMHKKTLRDNGIKLLSAMENIPDTPEGIILESLLEGMAEYYSAELSQKVRRGMNESRQKGHFTGGPLLYGYKVVNKKLQINEDEAEVIRAIFEKSASGMYVKDIIKDLTEQGIYYKGKPFKINTIHNFLRNEKFIGIVKYNEEIFKNIYPAIVSERLFKLVGQRLAANHYGKHKGDVVYLLKNKIICGYCGHIIQSASGSSRNHTVLRYYSCFGRTRLKKCNKIPIKKEIIEQIVLDTTFKMFKNEENLDILANKILEIHKERVGSVSTHNLLIREKENAKTALKNIMKCVEEGIVTQTTKQRIEELENKISEIDSKLTVEKTKYITELTKADITKFIRTSLKKEGAYLINLLVKKVVLYDDKVEIYYNYTDSNDTLEEFSGCPFYYDEFEKQMINTKFNGPEFNTIALDIIANV